MMWLPVVLAGLWGVAGAAGNEHNHQYAIGDQTTLWVNKVGPYNNPQETYNYYTLPFCKTHPDAKVKRKWSGLGEVLEGNELIDSQIDIRFRIDVDDKAVCTTTLGKKEVKHFHDAIRHHFWYELFMDDLPIWGFIGEFVFGANQVPALRNHTGHGDHTEMQSYIYTHRRFDISYNGDQIIMVNLTSENPQAIKQDTDLEFTYSVKWEPTDVKFTHRFERYLDYNFFEHQIHWFSIFNSFMMVIFLTGLVSLILMRTLRNDYAKYRREEDDVEALDRELSEESGWKLVHGDVFRPADRLMLLSALIGTGSQLTLLLLCIILLAIVGMMYVGRGTIVTACIVCYALTSFVSGYVAAGFYSRNEGREWIKCMILTGTLFPGLCFVIAFSLNTIAIFYHSLAAVPFSSMVEVFLIWACVSFPLVLGGTVVGRNWAGVADNPCRVKSIPRPIPPRQWYLTPAVVAFLGGLLPFGSIFIEMYFIFTSFWNYKVYYVYGFMLLVSIILIIVTTCVTIVGSYFLLNAENYHWQWTAFLSGASTAGYVYLYSFYFFAFKTQMTGFFQTCFYFGYTAMFCLGLGIMCGAVGFVGSSTFVTRIYRNIKCD